MAENQLTTRQVFQAISNEGSQELFNFITQDRHSYDIVEQGKISRKQYYHRLSKLLDSCLVKKVGKKYALTTFGIVVYEAQIALATAINQWQIKELVPLTQKIIEEQTKNIFDNILNCAEIWNNGVQKVFQQNDHYEK